MSIDKKGAKRKSKGSKAQTMAARREADRRQRVARRQRTAERQRHYRFRVNVVRMDRKLRQQVSEKEAVERTLARWQPTEDWPFPLSKSSIRHWHRQAERASTAALRPKSQRLHTIHYQVPEYVVGIIYILRCCWAGEAIAWLPNSKPAALPVSASRRSTIFSVRLSSFHISVDSTGAALMN